MMSYSLKSVFPVWMCVLRSWRVPQGIIFKFPQSLSVCRNARLESMNIIDFLSGSFGDFCWRSLSRVLRGPSWGALGGPRGAPGGGIEGGTGGPTVESIVRCAGGTVEVTILCVVESSLCGWNGKRFVDFCFSLLHLRRTWGIVLWFDGDRRIVE